MKIGLRRVDALCRSKCNVGVDHIVLGCGKSGHPHLLGLSLCVCMQRNFVFIPLCYSKYYVVIM